MIFFNGVVGSGGGSAVTVDTSNPQTHSGSYTYTDDDAIIVVRSQFKSDVAYVQYNLVTMTYICRDTGMYGMNDNPTLLAMSIPSALTLTFDGLTEISTINTATKTITGDSITVYKRV